MDCPECKATLVKTYITINGNPAIEIKCSKCFYMRIIDNGEVFSVNDLT